MSQPDKPSPIRHRFHVPYVAGNELEYLADVVETRSFAGNGPYTKRAQRFLEERYGVPHVLLTHSCTGAMELAALLLDLGPGDEVIVPSYTFASTATAFVRTGARVVFCEVEPDTMNIDLDDAAARITERTKLIVPVHYGGVAPDMQRLLAMAEDRGIMVLEDAAQGLESRQRGAWHGTMAPLGAISFHATKNVHCGLGGALFINRGDLFDRAENIWERGTDRSKMLRGLVDKYSWVELGSSFYPSELQAAVLLAQLESLERVTARRAQVYETYRQRLSGPAERGTFTVPRVADHDSLNYHSYFLILNSASDGEGLRRHLLARGIQAYIGYVPLHSSRMGRRLGYAPDDLPITEEYAHRVLRLPTHTELTVDDVSEICSAIIAFFAG